MMPNFRCCSFRCTRILARNFWTNDRFVHQIAAEADSDAISYLYIGRRATPFTVEPNLDFRQRFAEMDELKRLIERRSVDLSVKDVDELAVRYSGVIEPLRRQRKLQCELDILAAELKSTKKDEKYEEIVNEIKAKMRSKSAEFKEECRNVQEIESVLLACLKLPNVLDDTTPIGNVPKLIEQSWTKSDRKCFYDDFLSKRLYLQFKENPNRLYLSGAALELCEMLVDVIHRTFVQSGCRLVSPSHFARSSIVEAFGVDFRDEHLLRIASLFGEDNKDSVWALNLNGHGVFAYLALFVERKFSPNVAFPLTLYSVGTAYKSSGVDVQCVKPLLQHFQRPLATSFIIATSEDQLRARIGEMQTQVLELMKRLDINFELYALPSKQLLISESKRTDLMVTVGRDGGTVCCARFSTFDDFLSKRLRCMYSHKLSDNSAKASTVNYVHNAYIEIDIYTILAAIFERYFNIEGNLDGVVLANLAKKLHVVP